MEELTPTVSVLMPVRQWRDTTREAIDSILGQTLASLELLLIGQADVASLAALLPADRRIRLIPRAQPGIVGALNTGLAQARAPWIARMDDDDLAYPERLEKQLAHLEGNSGTQLCATRVRFVDLCGSPDTIREGNRRYQRWLNGLTEDRQIRHACYIECPLPHPSLMAHRDVWRQLEGYRHFDGPEDYDLVLRAMLLGIRLGKPPEVLLDWREHQDRLTHRDDRYRREAFAFCRARAAAQPNSGLGLAEGRGTWLCGVGRHARQWHDALEHQGICVHGFVDVHRHSSDRRKREKSVIRYEELPGRRDDSLVICAMTQPEARSQAQSYFQHHQWREGHDYILG